MSHTTSETSRLLAENGFPQPTPEFGEVWIDEDCTFIVARVDRDGYIHGISSIGNASCVFSPIDFATFVFAPTASDIIETMPARFSLVFQMDWICSVWEAGEVLDRFFGHGNPAEACAKAWLSLNK